MCRGDVRSVKKVRQLRQGSPKKGAIEVFLNRNILIPKVNLRGHHCLPARMKKYSCSSSYRSGTPLTPVDVPPHATEFCNALSRIAARVGSGSVSESTAHRSFPARWMPACQRCLHHAPKSSQKCVSCILEGSGGYGCGGRGEHGEDSGLYRPR